MSGNINIWDQFGTLTVAHDESGGSELPPLPGERGEPRPLRDILGRFVEAAPSERERFSLVLANGQAFSPDDIAEMLRREDSPFQ